MSREHWDERYGTEELIWKADPNRFLVEELGRSRPGPGTRRRLWRGTKCRVARLKGLAGDRRRLLPRRTGQGGSDWRGTEAWK